MFTKKARWIRMFFLFLILWAFIFHQPSSGLSEETDTLLPLAFLSVPFLLMEDEDIMEGLPSHLNQDCTAEVARISNVLGDGRFQLLTLAIMRASPDSYHQRSAHLAFNSWLKAGLYTWGLKILTGRARPGEKKQGFFGPSLEHHSFPSGHTSSAFAIATVLGERYKIKKLTFALATLAGLSRIILEKHYPSDVVAGALIGYLAGEEVLEEHKESIRGANQKKLILTVTPQSWKVGVRLNW